MVWLSGMALCLSLTIILSLIGVVLWNGFRTFWPAPIHLVTLRDGSTFLGMPVRSEAYESEPARVEALRKTDIEGALTTDGRVIRTLYRVGNKEILGEPFRWVDAGDIASIELPPHAVLVERLQWGPWIGQPGAIVSVEEVVIGADEPLAGTTDTEHGSRRFERAELNEAGGGGPRRVRQTTFVCEGPEETLRAFGPAHVAAVARRTHIERLKEEDVGVINRELTALQNGVRLAELRHAEGAITEADFGAIRASSEQRAGELRAGFSTIMERVRRLEAEDAMHRWIVTDPGTQRFAPISQSEPGSPMLLSQVVRCVPANDIGVVGKVRVYLARWWEFLTDGPRETNTEGGIMPVIFGTVAMTLLLCVLVVPMGVVAALYLREYARQGWVVSAVRVAVNNLAGVPSIVYGVFGLGFFCYSVGSWVDRGPQAPLSPQSWWGIVGLTVVLAAASIVLGLVAKIRPLRPDSAIKMLGRFLSLLGWLGVIVGVGVLVVRLPYFHGFFRERPAATFGTPGVLWASLTLALLTLPVVIVSTEEAISAVPRSLREGSYGCGASKWQTIRRVVLPRAAPGIMTGMILAMARGAGEVAPLMLVGAVKLASELPFEASFPWLHLERSFMHLGFHIFDLGFQSPDSEGARPLVWTTTFILMSVVVTLNITAIGLRARLRRRFGGGHF